MRCWSCDVIIVLPGLVGGKPGVAGQIRAGIPKPELTPQVVTLEVTCPRCGDRYDVTVAKKPGKGKVGHEGVDY